jgi:hypothetical protein
MGADGIMRWNHLANFEIITKPLIRRTLGLDESRRLQISRILWDK